MTSESSARPDAPSSTMEMARATARRSPASTFSASSRAFTARGPYSGSDRRRSEGSAIELAQAGSRSLQHLEGQLRLALHHRPEVPRPQDHEPRLAGRGHRGGSLAPGEERQLAEEVAGPQVSDPPSSPADPQRPIDDHEQVLVGVSLPHH